MKKITIAIATATSLSLAACGGSGDDALGDEYEDAGEAEAEALEDMADNATSEAAEEQLEDMADAAEDRGEAMEEAIDESDVNVDGGETVDIEGM